MSDVDPTLGRRTATDRRPHVRMTAGFFTDTGKLSHVVDPVERMATLGLHAAAIGMCRELGTDGHIVPEMVLAATGLPPQYAKTLMTDEVWHQADHGCRRCPQPRQDHVYLHDYLMHNRTAEQEKRTSERRRNAGQTGLQSRWGSHEKPQKPQRGPGRPRKNPVPQRAAEPVAGALPFDPHSGVVLVPVDANDTEPVLRHPAETKARAKRGRNRAEPRVFDPIVHELCAYFADLRQRNDPDGKRDNITETWLNACRLMIEADGRKPEDIRKAITYTLNHASHPLYVQSMPKLRQDYAKLQNWAAKDRKQQAAAAGRGLRQPAVVATAGMNDLYDDDHVPGGH